MHGTFLPENICGGRLNQINVHNTFPLPTEIMYKVDLQTLEAHSKYQVYMTMGFWLVILGVNLGVKTSRLLYSLSFFEE